MSNQAISSKQSTSDSPCKGNWGTWCFASCVVILVGWGCGHAVQTWLTAKQLTNARTLATTDTKRSEAAYRRYLQSNPTQSEVRLELVSLLLRSDPDAALEELRRIVPSDSLYAEAVRKGAALALERGRDYDAVEPLLFLQEKFPKDAGIQLALAQLKFRCRDFEAAHAHARRCRELNPNQTEAWLVEAESLDELKRSTEMVAPLEEALRLDPDLPQAHLNLAYAYPLVGREDEALEQVEWFLKRFPRSAAAHRTKALVQRARGEYEDALAEVRQSLELVPNQLEATLLEAELLLFLRHADEAYVLLDGFYKTYGPDYRLLVLLGRAAQLSGRQAEALQWERRLSRLSPNGRSS